MIRLPSRSLAALAVLAGAGWAAWSLARSLTRAEAELEHARPHTVYVLPSHDWLEFDLPRSASWVRLVTNAEITPAAARGIVAGREVEHPLRYALEYELRAGGRTLEAPRTYHHRARLTRFENEHGELLTAGFYLETDQVPLDPRTLRLPLEGALARADRLRVRLAPGSDVAGAVLRVFVREEVEARDLERRWFRLTRQARERLVRSHVYPQDLIDDAERLELMRYLWTPVAPAGAGWQDRQLYLLRDEAFTEVDDPVEVPPEGWTLTAGRPVTVRLPEAPTALRLELARAETAGPAEVDVRLWRDGEVAVAWTVPWDGWDGTSAVLRRSVEGGLLEIVAGAAVVVRVFAEGEAEDGSEDLELRLGTPLRLRPVAPEQDVAIRVLHAGPEPTPFRVDLRTFVDGGARPARLGWEVVDAAGTPLRRGVLEHPGAPSAGDVAVDEEGVARPLSEVSRFYFRMGPAARSLRLRAAGETPVWVAVFNRPGGLARRFQVATPEDGEVDERSWFFLRPPAAGSAVATLFERPRRPDPRLAAGEYAFESLLPVDAHGHDLLVPRREGAPLRPEARATSYREVPAGEALELVFDGRRPEVSVAPRLVWLRDAGTPFTLRAELAGQEVTARLAGRRGEVALPSVAPGRAVRLHLAATAAARWLVSHTVEAASARYARRFAFRFQGPVEVPYAKPSAAPDVVTIELFRRADRGASLELEVEILGAERQLDVPASDWTFLRRVVELPPAVGPPVPVLGRDDVELDAGRRFGVRLGADLPAGAYLLRLRSRREVDGYLRVSRTTPGTFERQELFVERDPP